MELFWQAFVEKDNARFDGAFESGVLAPGAPTDFPAAEGIHHFGIRVPVKANWAHCTSIKPMGVNYLVFSEA